MFSFGTKTFALLERDMTFRFVSDFPVATGDYIVISQLIGGTNTELLGQVEETAHEFQTHSQEAPVTLVLPMIPLRFNLGQNISDEPRYKGKGKVLGLVQEGCLLAQFEHPKSSKPKWRFRRAPEQYVKSYFHSAYSDKGFVFPVGKLMDMECPVRVHMIADGLKRHVGVFGQSGSGKSYALGTIVEEIHLWTEADVVILDPNGDLGRLNDESLRSYAEIAKESSPNCLEPVDYEQYAKRHSIRRDSIRLLSRDSKLGKCLPIVAKLSDLDTKTLAMALGIRSDEHFAEYAELSDIRQGLSTKHQKAGYDLHTFMRCCKSDNHPRILNRIVASELQSLPIWNGGQTVKKYIEDETRRTIVIDLSDLSKMEKSIVSLVVFKALWEKQMQRKRNGEKKATILVMDEAHALFPRTPLSLDETLTLEWGAKMAGEGRKFGIYLMIASQLPSKIHNHVLTQCGSIVLMKMLSQSDIDALGDAFSYVPEMLLQRSRHFGIGDSLAIGPVVPGKCLVHFEGRKTKQGGADLEVWWNMDVPNSCQLGHFAGHDGIPR